MNIYKVIEFNISLIILIQSFYKVSSTTSLDYPYFITLANDNIFLIQKTGIDIYDQSLNKINQIFEFSGKEEMTEENFLKIELKYNKEYILSIINDRMFIFNNEGKLLYKSEEKINSNQIIYSYSLAFIHEANNNCDYVVGYFDKNCYINIFIYRYDNEKNNIKLLSQYKDKNYSYTKNSDFEVIEFTDNQKLLSCEYMFSGDGGFLEERNLLVCFFNSNANVGIVVFNILEDKIYNKIEIVQYIGLLKNSIFISTENIDNNKNIASIKSELINNRTLAIVWWNFKDNNQTRYYIYDLTKMLYIYKFSGLYTNIIKDLYSWELNNTCIKSKYGERVNVFTYKNQFAFSCIIDDENIQILLYNKMNLMNDSFIKNIYCENYKELTKLYFNNNNNYLIFPCSKNCSDEKFENDPDCINEKENEEEYKREREREENKRREVEIEEENKRENEEENKRENEGENEEENEEEEEEENKRENKIEKEEENEEEEEEGKKIDNKRKNEKLDIIIIIIIIIIISLLILFIAIFRKNFKKKNYKRRRKKGKDDEKLMGDTLTKLLPK